MGRGSLADTLRGLATDRGIQTVMLECGGKLAGEMMDAGLIDEVAAFMAPMLCGGPVPALGGQGSADGIRLSNASFRRLGPDVMARAMIDHTTLTVEAH